MMFNYATSIVLAFAVSSPIASVSGSQPCEGVIETTTDLDFFNSVITRNDLHMPDGELRYGNIGKVGNQVLDLVVTATNYSHIDGSPNGKGPGEFGKFGQIGLKTIKREPESGEGTFRFCFVEPGTNTRVKVASFQWSIFDIDRRRNSDGKRGIHEKMLIDTRQTSGYSLLSGTEIKQSCDNSIGSAPPCDDGVLTAMTVFESTVDGTKHDNPTDPDNLTKKQMKRSVVFTFEDKDCFEMVYNAYCPFEPDNDCSWYGGSNFFFAGTAKQIIQDETCVSITPRPTPAPTLTPTPSRTPTYSPTECDKENGRKLSSLGEKFALKNPVSNAFDQVTNTFSLTYDVHDSIEQGNIFATIYDEDCAEGNNELTVGIGSVTTVVGPNIGEATLAFVLDTSALALNTDVFAAVAGNTAEMKMCSRFMLKTKTGEIEVNFIESIITVFFDLTAGFELASFVVESKDMCTAVVGEKDYNVEAYLCDPSNLEQLPTVGDESSNNNVFQQGSLISVCVTPDADSKTDGIVMTSIDNFKWTRQQQDVGDPIIEQPAIEGGNPASNLLTRLNCESGWPICSFSSLLFADFYVNAGKVAGNGTVSLQFGDNGARLLVDSLADNDEEQQQQRTLQEVDPAATSVFDISVGISKSEDDGPAYALRTAGAVHTTTTTTTTALVSFLALFVGGITFA